MPIAAAAPASFEPRPATRALDASRRLLALLTLANHLYAAMIVAIFVGVLLAPEPVLTALGVRPDVDRGPIHAGFLAVAVLGFAGTRCIHRILVQLRAIVGTVRDGDPFVPDNAARLESIAWSTLVLELLHLAVGAVTAAASTTEQPFDVDWSFSFAPWIAVLLLFVLARVFREGTRLRDDLAGVV